MRNISNLDVTKSGCTSSYTHNITISGPSSSISGPSSGCISDVLNFTAGNAGGGATYDWSVTGGGSPSSGTGLNFSTSFASAGSKTITLTVTQGGCVSVYTQNVTINAFPSSGISGPSSGCVNTSTTFNANPPVSGATYTWTGTGVAGGSGSSYSPTFTTTGIKTITLDVSVGGCTSSYSHNITINPQPSSGIIAPATGCQDSSITFSAINAGANMVYNWNFGSGASPSTGTGQSPPLVTYSSTGTKTVALKVINTLTNCETDYSHNITINACTPCGSKGTIWVFDEDSEDPNAFHLWSFTDYNNAAGTGTDYGRVHWIHPINGDKREVSEARDLEAMGVNRFTGQAYFLSSGRTDDVGSTSQALWTYNLNDAAANINNIEFKIIAHIAKPSGETMEALAFDPVTKRFYMGDDTDGGGNSSGTADNLYYIDLYSLDPDPFVINNPTLIGTISGLGESNNYVDGLEFTDDGRLFSVDGTDDELYELNPTTGAIISVSDNNIPGGLPNSVDVETISWDDVNGVMVGVDNRRQRFIDITLGSNGNNSELSYFDIAPGMNPNVDFESSAIYTICDEDQVGVGNLIFIDHNKNGLYDNGEGEDSVLVQLFEQGDDPQTAIPITQQYTKNGGCYLFENLIPEDYFVHIPASQFQAGAPLDTLVSLTPEGIDDGTDDDADENGINAPNPATTGVSSGNFTLAPDTEPEDSGTETGKNNTIDNADDNNTDLTIDFGFTSNRASLGDTVWHDLLTNGIQDPGEQGIENVTVTLYDASTSTAIATTTTNNAGYYHFGGLIPGDFYVVFDISTSSVPTYILTSQNQGSDDSIDSDADPTGKTHTVTLTGGQHDPTIDAGYFTPCKPRPKCIDVRME